MHHSPGVRNSAASIVPPTILWLVTLMAGLLPPGRCGAATGPDGLWFQVSDPLPIARYNALSAYDPVRKRMWMFGGLNLGTGDELWFRPLTDVQTWTQVPRAGSWPGPMVATNQGLVYDSAQDRLIAVGGGAAPETLWALGDLGGTPTWSRVPTVGTPPGSFGGAVYDPIRNRILVLALGSPACASLDLTASPPSWSTLVPATAAGPQSWYGSVIDDQAADRLVYFGGLGTAIGGPRQDVWTLNLSGTPAWNKESPAGPPPPGRSNFVANYDLAHERMIVVGGSAPPTTLGDVWTLDLTGSMAWSPGFAGVTAIPAREQQAQVFDPDSDRVVIFSGVDFNAFVFRYDEVTLGPAGQSTRTNAMDTRYAAAASYDPGGRDMIAFGGVSGASTINSTLALRLDPRPIWRALATQGTPPPGRYEHAQAVDPAGHRLLVYGGLSAPMEAGGATLGDTWQLALDDPPTWTQLFPGGAQVPDPRFGMASAFDPVSRRLIVFGGRVAFFPDASLWALALDGAPTWSLLSSGSSGPIRRAGAAMAYDSRRHRMLLFGGDDYQGIYYGNLYNDVWAYDLDATGADGWGALSTMGTPPSPRELAAAVYDSVSDRLVVFGGYDISGPFRSDVWELALGDPTPTWARLFPGRSAPSVYGYEYAPGPGSHRIPFGGAAAIYDPVYDRMVATCLGPNLGETWQLAWVGIPTPALVSLLDETPAPGRVRLRWYTADGAGVSARVERTTDGASWDALATIVSDGSGVFTYEDVLAAGGRYGYRLAVAAGDGAARTDVTWVDVPAARAGLALAAVHPNPAHGAPVLSFTLATGGPAALAVYDVAGRRVLARDLAALGAGPHTLDLRGALPPRAGIYFVTLRQGEAASTRRFVLLP